MKEKAPILKAVKLLGGQSALAHRLSEVTGRNVRQCHVWNWINRPGPLPAQWAIPFEKATEGRITRQALRPDIYPDAA
jgi:DNA-binding transcriptional regulator YdaS (Cro superfamily)